MRVAFCTNIEPVDDPSSLRGRNSAIIDRLEAEEAEIEVLYGPEPLLQKPASSYCVGILAPNDQLEAVPDPVGRLRAETVALALEDWGVPFVNSPLRRRFCQNKLLAALAFRRAGLPQPVSWATNEPAATAWHEGVVVKPVTGSGGLGVVLVHSRGDAERHASGDGGPYFFQRFVPDARCIRVVATQRESIGRYEKRVERGTVVATVAGGAREVKLPRRHDLDELAIAMVRAVGMDIGGTDILEGRDGDIYALEVNANFGFYPKNREIVDALLAQVVERAGLSGTGSAFRGRSGA
jgi:glutathione synthase/RimK-type ligase-like ATP-grasp enzyme